jgi:sulfhydrogenase subunit gamma (sulfur reductase)
VQNPYLPYPVRIDDIIVEAEDKSLKTFKFVFLNEGDEEKYAYKAGQFGELSIPGKGEIPIGIASSPVEKGFVKFTVNRAGVVTTHLHNMKVGDIMGLRGRLGNWYPWELLEGKTSLSSAVDLPSPPCDLPSFTCWIRQIVLSSATSTWFTVPVHRVCCSIKTN